MKTYLTELEWWSSRQWFEMAEVKSDTMGPLGQARWAGGAAELRLTSHFRLEFKSEMLKSRERVSMYAVPTQRTVVQCSAARQQQTPFLLQLYFRCAASMAQ